MFFPLQFSTLKLHTTHNFCMSQSPKSLLLSHSFVAIKQNIYLLLCLQRGQSHCAAEQQWRCTVLTTSKFHTYGCMTPVTESLTHTISLLSAAVPYTHSPILTLQPKSYYRELNSKFSLTLTSDSHHCTQLFPHPVPQTHITLHNISLTLYLRHTSLYTTFPLLCTSDTHHCTQYFPQPVPQTHITVHNISLTQ